MNQQNKATALAKAMAFINELKDNREAFEANQQTFIDAYKERKMDELLTKAKHNHQVNEARKVEHLFNPVREATEIEVADYMKEQVKKD